MNLTTKLTLGAALLGASTFAAAAAFDGSVPMLCAVTDTVSCDSVGVCIEGSAEAVNLPVFLAFDVQNKVARSAQAGGEERSSEILSVHEADGALVLLGAEHNRGWSASIGESTGKLTLTLAEEGFGYLIFGACVVGHNK